MAYKITIIKVKYLKEGFYIQISPFTMGMEFFYVLHIHENVTAIKCIKVTTCLNVYASNDVHLRS